MSCRQKVKDFKFILIDPFIDLKHKYKCSRCGVELVVQDYERAIKNHKRLVFLSFLFSVILGVFVFNLLDYERASEKIVAFLNRLASDYSLVSLAVHSVLAFALIIVILIVFIFLISVVISIAVSWLQWHCLMRKICRSTSKCVHGGNHSVKIPHKTVGCAVNNGQSDYSKTL